MTHLLDTDVCIAVLRGRDAGAQIRLRAMPEAAISTITIAELAHGAARSSAPDTNEAEVRGLAAALRVIELDADAAWHAGRIRADLARNGTPIGGYDVLIAGVARSRDLTLVTGNVREFRRVPGLRIEKW